MTDSTNMRAIRGLFPVILIAGLSVMAFADSKKVTLESGVSQHLVTARRLLDEGKSREAIVHAQVVSLESPIRLLEAGSAFDGRILEAATIWNRTLGIEALRVVARHEGHDITFRFVQDLRYRDQEVAGLTDWTREVWFGEESGCRIHGLVRARIRLPEGRAMPAPALTQILLHELGHVLGLADGGDGVMGPLDPDHPILSPSTAELRAIEELVREARRIRTAAAFPGVLDTRGVHSVR